MMTTAEGYVKYGARFITVVMRQIVEGRGIEVGPDMEAVSLTVGELDAFIQALNGKQIKRLLREAEDIDEEWAEQNCEGFIPWDVPLPLGEGIRIAGVGAIPDAHMLAASKDAALYVVVNGMKVARRGTSDVPTEHMKWIPLIPGWHVRDVSDDELEIYHEVGEQYGGMH